MTATTDGFSLGGVGGLGVDYFSANQTDTGQGYIDAVFQKALDTVRIQTSEEHHEAIVFVLGLTEFATTYPAAETWKKYRARIGK